MFEYISDVDYGVDKSRPAVCFGFSVKENSLSDYEVDLYFNDLWPRDYRAIPDQKKPGADPSIKTPILVEYDLYTEEG